MGTCFPRKPHVGQQLGREQIADIRTLILLIRAILQVVGEIPHSILLRIDGQLGTVAEGRTQQLDMRIRLVSPDDASHRAIILDSKCTEVHNDRNVFAEPRHTGHHRESVAVELGRQANLQLLGRSREGLL